MFPIIPLLALVSMLGGAGALYWYSGLTSEQKEEADRIAGQYALNVFGKTMEELTSAEAKQVHSLTKKHFVG